MEKKPGNENVGSTQWIQDFLLAKRNLKKEFPNRSPRAAKKDRCDEQPAHCSGGYGI